jgi:cellobiose phosphorylase
VLLNNRRGQSGLWSYGISGDAPIVLLRISDPEKIEIVRQLIQAHSYWRMKGLTVDLVILNEDVSVYRQSLQDQITSLISSGIEAQMLDKPGGIFVRRLEQVPNDDRVLLQSGRALSWTMKRERWRNNWNDAACWSRWSRPLLTPTRSARPIRPRRSRRAS